MLLRSDILGRKEQSIEDSNFYDRTTEVTNCTLGRVLSAYQTQLPMPQDRLLDARHGRIWGFVGEHWDLSGA